MSKEVDAIRQVVDLRRQSLDVAVRKKKEEENSREIRERALASEIEIKKQNVPVEAAKNRKIFENAGIIKLLEEIMNSGTLRYYLDEKDKPEVYESKEPIYRKHLFSDRESLVGYRQVQKHCEPAHIEWKGTTEYRMSDGNDYNCGSNNDQISIIFNYKWGPTKWSGDKYFGSDYDSTVWDEISFTIKDGEIYTQSKVENRKIHIYDKPQKISEIPDMGQHLAKIISEAIN